MRDLRFSDQQSPHSQPTVRLAEFAIGMAAAFLLSVSAPAYAQDADAAARELSNPATSLASLGNKIEVRNYDGSLPGAGDQLGVKYIFQPVLPFVLDSGDKVIFRPAFNVPIDEPFFDNTANSFDSGGGFGDIGFDLLYSPKSESKFNFGVGLVGGTPTGTNENLRSGNWTAGPEVFGAYIDDWGLVGSLVTHSWDVAGWGPTTNLTSMQYFYFLSLGDGWQLGAGPTATYNWNAKSGDRWNVPVGLGVAKTMSLFGMLWKFNVEADYSVVHQDSFGPEWLFKFNVTPVIANPFQ